MKKTDTKTIATKYAKATFEIAQVNNQVELVLNQLLQLKKIIENTGMQDLLNSPMGLDIWNDLAQEVKSNLNPVTSKLLQLLDENGRISLLVEVVNAYQDVCDKHFGVARGLLITATQLDPEQVESMQKIVTQRLGKQVVFEHKSNPDILGGVVAKVAGWTFDDSLKTHLDKLTQRLVN